MLGARRVGCSSSARVVADCGSTGPIDLAWVRENRVALWAQALSEYEAGAQWWLTQEESATHAEAVQEHVQVDPQIDLVEKFLLDKEQVTLAEVLREGLRMADPRRGDQNRVGAMMRHLGWTKGGRVGAARVPTWVRSSGSVQAAAPEPAKRAGRRAGFGVPRYEN